MEELDLLKKNWQQNDSFAPISELEIYKMLHKKSASVVKWILIISIIEFLVINGVALLLNDKSYNRFLSLHPSINFLDKFNYLVVIVFILLFYKNYKAISVLNPSKTLIEQILKARKTVTYYIYWNIIISGFAGSYAFIEGVNKGANFSTKNKEILKSNCINLCLVAFLIMSIVWVFYKLLYGSFLNKLSKNYNELKKIEL